MIDNSGISKVIYGVVFFPLKKRLLLWLKLKVAFFCKLLLATWLHIYLALSCKTIDAFKGICSYHGLYWSILYNITFSYELLFF